MAESNAWPTYSRFRHTFLPFPKFKIKILERPNVGFMAVPNVAIKSAKDGSPDWISGLGSSVDEALEDALKNLMAMLGERMDLTEADFEWSDPHDF